MRRHASKQLMFLTGHLLLAVSVVAKTTYTIQEVGLPEKDQSTPAIERPVVAESYAHAINDQGIVAGEYNYEGQNPLAYLTTPEGYLRNIDDNGAKLSSGLAINESGVIAGYHKNWLDPDDNERGIVVSVAGQMTAFSAFDGYFPGAPVDGMLSRALGINDPGVVVGVARYGVTTAAGQENVWHAFITNPANHSMIDLGLGDASAHHSVGTAISNNGQVVGYLCYDAKSTNCRGFIREQNNVMMLPDSLAGTKTMPLAINATGQVVGEFVGKGNNIHAFVTGANVMNRIELGTLSGTESHGLGINDSGIVTGYYSKIPDGNGGYDQRSHAFVAKSDGTMKDLTSLLTGAEASNWQLQQATDINNLGQITGYGVHNGQTRAFILNPLQSVNSVYSVNRDGATLSERQFDQVNCLTITNPSTRKKEKSCRQNTSSRYAVRISVSNSTLQANNIDLDTLTTNTPFSIGIGNLYFSGTLATADLDKHQQLPTQLPASWTARHCAPPDAACASANSKPSRDGVVKISADSKHNLRIAMAGRKFSETVDSESYIWGQQAYVNLCLTQVEGKSVMDDSVELSIGDQKLSLALNVNCHLTKTNKKIPSYTSVPYRLNNVKIGAKLIGNF